MEPRRTYLDTHVAAWLFDGRVDLGQEGRAAIDRDELLISPIVLLELELLREIGRRRAPAAEVLLTLESQFGVRTCQIEFLRVIEAALGCGWTRDPFDRMIVGQARAGNGMLITRDRNILSNVPEAIW